MMSKICGVYPSTVAKWIDDGKIKAFVTVGSHRRVKAEDLLEFLMSRNIPVQEDLKSLPGRSVLIAEDNLLLAKTMAKFLEASEKEYVVYTAPDGFCAGRLFNEKKTRPCHP